MYKEQEKEGDSLWSNPPLFYKGQIKVLFQP